jgi:hypothetical protein
MLARIYHVLALDLGDVSWLASVIALSVGMTFAILYLLGFRPRRRK